MLVLGAWEAGAGVTPSEQNAAKRGKRFKEQIMLRQMPSLEYGLVFDEESIRNTP